MAWPPDSIAADKANATDAVDDHAPHHNALAGAINDLVAFGPVASTELETVATSGLYDDLIGPPNLDAKADLITGKVPQAQIPGVVIQGILDPLETPPSPGVWLRRGEALVEVGYNHVGSYVSSDNVGTGDITLNKDVPAGSLLVVGVASGGDTQTHGVSDDKSNTWTAGTLSTTSGTPHSRAQIYYTVVTNALSLGDKITITRSNNGGMVVHGAEITGYDNEFESQATDEGSSRTPTLPGVAAANNSIVFWVSASQANRPVIDVGGGFETVAGNTSSGGTSARSGWLIANQVETAATVTATLEYESAASSYAVAGIEFT